MDKIIALLPIFGFLSCITNAECVKVTLSFSFLTGFLMHRKDC